MANPYIALVIEKITNLLAPIGINLEQEIAAGKGARAVWQREYVWKVDAVELAQKHTSSNRFFISYLVYLKGTNIPIRLFDGNTLEGLRRGTTSFSIPGKFSRVFGTPAGFAASVAKKVADQLHWFDELATPEGCLRRLRTGNAVGAGSGGKAFDFIETTLEELASRGPDGL